jgi:hypothetical protein
MTGLLPRQEKQMDLPGLWMRQLMDSMAMMPVRILSLQDGKTFCLQTGLQKSGTLSSSALEKRSRDLQYSLNSTKKGCFFRNSL